VVVDMAIFDKEKKSKHSVYVILRGYQSGKGFTKTTSLGPVADAKVSEVKKVIEEALREKFKAA